MFSYKRIIVSFKKLLSYKLYPVGIFLPIILYNIYYMDKTKLKSVTL